MKALIWFLIWFLLGITPLANAAEELQWVPVDIPGLEISGSAAQNLGLWFQGDFGWLNSGKDIWITHNAGRTWKLSLTAPEGRSFYDSYFINALEGWAVAGIFPSFLFHTQDGGTSWQPIELELIQTSAKPEHPGSVSPVRIYFKDSLSSIGTFVIEKFPVWGGSIVARTEDGGKSWVEIVRDIPFPQLIGIGEHVWISGDHSINYTPDFGETFRTISKPSEYRLFLISPLHGWTVDYSFVGESFPKSIRYEVLKMKDGGNTWSEPIFSRTTNFLNYIQGFCLISEDVGGFLWHSESDEPSLLYVTRDGGTSWISYRVPIRDRSIVSCNRQHREMWLFPVNKEATLFYASIDTVTAVQNSNKLLTTTWASMKKTRK